MDTHDLTASARPELDLSIVVPLFNEEESLPELMAWIDNVLSGRAYEVVFVDDGSTDGSWEVVQQLKAEYGDRVVELSFAREPGQSAARTRISTWCAALWSSPWMRICRTVPMRCPNWSAACWKRASIWSVAGKEAVRPDHEDGADQAVQLGDPEGQRIHLHDFNCGLKAYRREVVRAVEVNGEIRGTFPCWRSRPVFRRSVSKWCSNRARKYGSSKFGGAIRQRVPGFADHCLYRTVRTSRCTCLGARDVDVLRGLRLVWGHWGHFKLWAISQGLEAKNIAEISAFYVAAAFMIMGVQLFLAILG